MVLISRGLTPAQIAARSGTFVPVVLADIDWPSGRVRAHSGVGTIQWGGFAWTGVGRYGGLQLPEAGIGMAATSATLTLHGEAAQLLEECDVPVRGRAVVLYSGVLTARDSATLASPPDELFAGHISAVSLPAAVGDDGGVRVITHALEVVIGVGPGQRSIANIYHSYEDQIARYPDDTAGRLTIRARDRMAKMRWPEN